MSRKTIGNFIMFVLWLPFFACCIDAFFDITPFTNKIIQIVWFLSLYCGCKLFVGNSNPPVVKKLFLFAGVLVIYGTFHLLFGEALRTDTRIVPQTEYLIAIVNSLFPIFLVYYYSKKGYITENSIRKWSLLFIAAVLISYPNSVVHIRTITDAEQFTNNIGYKFLRCIPLLLFWYKKPIFQYAMFLVLGIFIINSLKRGPILIWLILFGILMFQNYKRFNYISAKQKSLLIILPILVILFGFYYFNNYLEDNVGFMNRLNSTLEGNDSGRGEIYNDILNVFISDNNALHYIFGNGAESTIKFFQIHAHNDWLELLINQGLTGIMCYILYFKSFWSQIKIKISTDIFGRNLLVNVFIMVLITSAFSMSYMAYDTSIHLVLGYAIYRSINPKIINN